MSVLKIQNETLKIVFQSFLKNLPIPKCMISSNLILITAHWKSTKCNAYCAVCIIGPSTQSEHNDNGTVNVISGDPPFIEWHFSLYKRWLWLKHRVFCKSQICVYAETMREVSEFNKIKDKTTISSSILRKKKRIC